MLKRIPGILMLALGVSLSTVGSSAALAKERSDHIAVIQERIYDKKHEITFEAGYIPSDFFDNFPLGISYTYHFNETLGWEVVRLEGVASSEKDIVSQLEEDFQVEPTEFDSLKSMIHTSLVYKPTYGKDALLNKSVINHETMLTVGLGLASYETEFPEEASTSETAMVLSFGFGRKYFISKNFSFILQARDLITFKDDETENNVYLGVGLSYRFDFAGKRVEGFEKADSVYKYLKNE